jgi:hypothetical protein
MLIGKLYSIRTGLLLTMAGIQFGDNFKTQELLLRNHNLYREEC